MTLESYLQFGINARRHLHEYPELGREEFKTTAYCQEVMISLGYKVTLCFATGFYADLHISDDLPTIAYRADMDALPALEKAGEVVCSKHDGVAHLCGHDMHMAVSLTAAKIMVEHRDSLKANVRFLFQPSEEMFRGGAKGMIDEGCLDGVDFVYGQHNVSVHQAPIDRKSVTLSTWSTFYYWVIIPVLHPVCYEQKESP